ncbi:hypothetical protein Hanom_Chr07g00646581 [Helianthus anomalus]
MPHTCHPLHQYLFLGYPHRLLPKITVSLPQTCVTYQHRPPLLCPKSMSTTSPQPIRKRVALFAICSSTKTQATFSI